MELSEELLQISQRRRIIWSPFDLLDGPIGSIAKREPSCMKDRTSLKADMLHGKDFHYSSTRIEVDPEHGILHIEQQERGQASN